MKVARLEDDDIWLEDGDGEEVRLVDDSAAPSPGSSLDVFIYTSSQGEPLATTTIAKVSVGETALLDVVSKSDAGLWLDWGLPQDLLLPISEMSQPVSQLVNNGKVFVFVFLDDEDRLCASTRFHHFLEEHSEDFKRWQPVNLTIAATSTLGFKAIINEEYLGLLYADEVFQPLTTGEHIQGYIKGIREDGRIDLTLYPERVVIKDELGKRILADLQKSGGVSMLTDKSRPEEIYEKYQVSKKNYKRALSGLYKARLIELDHERVKLVKS